MRSNVVLAGGAAAASLVALLIGGGWKRWFAPEVVSPEPNLAICRGTETAPAAAEEPCEDLLDRCRRAAAV